MIYRNEAQLRMMLANSLAVHGTENSGSAIPPRQNPRTPLIEAALAPAPQRFSNRGYKNLPAALALIRRTEAMVVFRDVLPLSERKARKIKSSAQRSKKANARTSILCRGGAPGGEVGSSNAV